MSCHLNLLLDVEVAGSAGFLDAQLSQLDVDRTLVVQLLLVLLSKVAAIVWKLLFILLHLRLPPFLVICTASAVTAIGIHACAFCHGNRSKGGPPRDQSCAR